jgi:hypothetical protein
LSAVREAVAQIPPDAYHDAQVRTADRARQAPSDNPSVDELEHWVAPPITIDHVTDPSAPVYPLEPGNAALPFGVAATPGSAFDIDAQLRRTQIFLGAFGGYVVGHWVMGAWYLGLAFAVLGIILAVINRAFVSIPACGMLSLSIAGHQQRWMEPFHPYLYLIALPLGILFGSFLSDFWRFTSVREEQPTSEEGYPVEPSGIAVTPETKLTIGATVLVPAQGRWWRAVVIAFEGPERVRVRYPGWDAKWEEAVSRNELQVPTQ